MSLGFALMIGSTLLAALAVIATVSAFDADDAAEPRRLMPDERPAPSIAAGAGAGIAVAALTGWLLPAIVIAGAVGLGVRTMQRTDRTTGHAERTDALASWIENLRDVLIAGDQPIGAIGATVTTCPIAIRPQVRRLAAGLGRQSPDVVFRRFADELDDPLGDLVAAGLLIAVQRGARTAAVLTALAEQARQQSDRRRLVDAERAPIAREVNVLTAIMAMLLAALFVFGRSDFLGAYDTSDGQLFLGAVLVVYSGLLFRVRRLSKFPQPSRFLTGAATPAAFAAEVAR